MQNMLIMYLLWKGKGMWCQLILFAERDGESKAHWRDKNLEHKFLNFKYLSLGLDKTHKIEANK